MRTLCFKCYRSQNSCLCHFIQSFPTKTKFCLLMHPKEARKERTGTGRATHLFLENSELFVGVNFNHHSGLLKLLKDSSYQPLVLYPGKDAINVSQIKTHPISKTKKKYLIFIIDGTWPCAKKIMKESTILHSLPKLSFTHKQTSQFVIKQQPHELCLSTIESVSVILNQMNELKIESLTDEPARLVNYLKELVNFQVQCANDPEKQTYRRGEYTPPKNRQQSKKWESRKIFFELKNV